MSFTCTVVERHSQKDHCAVLGKTIQPSNHLTRTRYRTTHLTLGRLPFTVISLMEVGERRQPPGCNNEGTPTAGPTVQLTFQILCLCLYRIEFGFLFVIKLEVTL